MIKYTILTLALVTIASCHEGRKHKVEDPLAALDRHLTHTLAYHYLWPWSQLMQAAAAVAEAEESLEEPKIESNKNVYRVHMSVKKFRPDELSVKVRNQYIIVEGRHKENSQIKQFIANHFVQRLALPPGSKPEEVTAVLNEKSILTISVPKHELPPPPPEREVPIEVRLSQVIPETSETSSEKIESSSQNPDEVSEKTVEEVSSAKPLETSTNLVVESSMRPIDSSSVKYLSSTPAPLDLDAERSTAHHGKIRKKELKNSSKTTKDNEVTKGIDTNGLDYTLIEELE